MRWVLAAWLLLLLWPGSAQADYLEVIRPAAHLKDGPVVDATSLRRLVAGDTVLLLDEGVRENGYYRARTEDGIEGWVYRTLVRGHLGDPPAWPLQPVLPSPGSLPNALLSGMNFWFGNIHAHTSEGSGEGGVTPSTHEEAFLYARDEAGLDFLAVTPHNHFVDASTYDDLLTTTLDPTYFTPGVFVPMAGQEFSSISRGNHVNVFALDAWVSPSEVANGEFDGLFEDFIPDHATDLTFAQFNHPYSGKFTAKSRTEFGRDDFPDLDAWVEATDPWVTAIEVVSAPSHGDAEDRPHVDEHPTRLAAWLWAVQNGWKLAPTANQDNHRPNWGNATDSRTVAVAPELTPEDLAAAFQQRRFYATEDSTLRLVVKSGGAWMGEVVSPAAFDGITVAAHDPEEPQATYRVRIYAGFVREQGDPERTTDLLKPQSAPLHDEELTSGQSRTWALDGEAGTFYTVRVSQSLTSDDPNGTEDDAWSAPIWIVGDPH